MPQRFILDIRIVYKVNGYSGWLWLDDLVEFTFPHCARSTAKVCWNLTHLLEGFLKELSEAFHLAGERAFPVVNARLTKI